MAKHFGRYEVLERISKGGMAEVYKGRSTGAAGFEKVVAIKRILPSLSDDPMFVAMFVEEAKLSANLNHVNIAQIYEFGELDGQYFIAMEFVHGKDLRALQRHFRHSGESMPIPITVRIALDICSALDYAHNRRDANGSLLRIVHRDISPPNVLISYEGAVKLIDFGIAKALTRNSSTATGMLKGKLGYLSPEQAEGRELDGRSDIFALGTVLWELLTGVRLFHEATDMATLMKVRRAEVAPPSELNPEVSSGLDAIVLTALSRDTATRFQRADLFYEALERVARQPGMGFSAIQLGRFMASTFAAALDEPTAVATPSPSPLRIEVLAPEPALDAPSPPLPRPQARPGPVVERTPTPIRRADRTPAPRPLPSQPHLRPAGLPPSGKSSVLSTGPQQVLTPEALATAVAEEDVDPSTRVSAESAQLAKSLTTQPPTPQPAPRPREQDRIGLARVPSRVTPGRPTAQPPAPEPPREPRAPEPRPASPEPRSRSPRRPDGVRGAQPVESWQDETIDLVSPAREPSATPSAEAHAMDVAAPSADDWEDAPTSLKEEPAVAAIVAALAADGVIPSDEWQPPAKAVEPDTGEVLLRGKARPPPTEERRPLPLDLGEMIESAMVDLVAPGSPTAPEDWPEPMESPELDAAPSRAPTAPRPSAAPPVTPAPNLAPARAAPAGVLPAPRFQPAPPPVQNWDDGPTRFEPEGSPAMAAELGSEHALGEADRMVLAPPASGEIDQDDLPEPRPPMPARRRPLWPWLLLGLAVLSLLAAVLMLALR